MEVQTKAWKAVPGRRISIFLSIWDVHVNRSPMAGRFGKVEYRPGRFYNAMRSRASVENEQNVIHLQTERGEMVFKQIAGAIARRVVCWKAPGDDRKIGRTDWVDPVRFAHGCLASAGCRNCGDVPASTWRAG